ncbi:hypothetical protein E4T56_gene2838 [Termitomyces sp. T112]|nr:hypothetical protein E4T56_gene2838 [Termitomyces sp. T112]
MRYYPTPVVWSTPLSWTKKSFAANSHVECPRVETQTTLSSVVDDGRVNVTPADSTARRSLKNFLLYSPHCDVRLKGYSELRGWDNALSFCLLLSLAQSTCRSLNPNSGAGHLQSSDCESSSVFRRHLGRRSSSSFGCLIMRPLLRP